MGAKAAAIRILLVLAVVGAVPMVPASACAAEGRIAYEDMGSEDIFSVNPDGTDNRNLTNSPDRYEGYPDWSPDGTKLAFTTRTAPDHLFVMNADGSGVVRITRAPREEAGFDGEGPAFVAGFHWSPSSDKLVYSYGFSGGGGGCEPYRGPARYSILIANVDGTNHVRLTGSRAENLAPKWSPDGTRILFNRYPREGRGGLFVMNVDGTEVRRLTGPRKAFDSGATWSPDSTRILFNRINYARYGSYGEGDIFVMDADGSNRTRLTDDGTDREPTWSPDGTRIAWLSDRERGHHLWLMNPDGSEKFRVTEHQVADADHGGKVYSWSPTGERLVYERFPANNEEDVGIDLYVVDVDGTDTRLLTDGFRDRILPDWQNAPAP